jgi:hypothetical protein
MIIEVLALVPFRFGSLVSMNQSEEAIYLWLNQIQNLS